MGPCCLYCVSTLFLKQRRKVEKILKALSTLGKVQDAVKGEGPLLLGTKER